MRTIGTPSTQARKLNAIASGALPNGDPVVVNSDGTVSVVAETSASEAVGTEVVFNDSYTRYTDVVYDTNAQKVVIGYMDPGNSNKGNALVGTVDPSDNSITYGSEVNFEAGATEWVKGTYDANAGRVVFAYRDDSNSGKGTAVVGVVSGTSVSFGTPATFTDSQVQYVNIAYDSNAQKVAIVYTDQTNSNASYAVVGTTNPANNSISFGTAAEFESTASYYHTITYDENAQKSLITFADSVAGDARVASISGTSISFGANVSFNNSLGVIAAAYDPIAQKIAVFYNDGGNGNKLTGIVATISGTSVTFGAETAIGASIGDIYAEATYDSIAKKIVLAYRDNGDSNKGKVVTATISGTTLSFGTPILFNNGSTNNIGVAFDSNAGKTVICYEDEGNTEKGTAIVYQPAYTSTNLTAENYIGLASNGYPDTAGATIDVQGAINDKQSGLTAGQAYYVQTDGTLTTTAGDPSVFAGTAISATKMIVKG